MHELCQSENEAEITLYNQNFAKFSLPSLISNCHSSLVQRPLLGFAKQRNAILPEKTVPFDKVQHQGQEWYML
jgi:hypothetical protein